MSKKKARKKVAKKVVRKARKKVARKAIRKSHVKVSGTSTVKHAKKRKKVSKKLSVSSTSTHTAKKRRKKVAKKRKTTHVKHHAAPAEGVMHGPLPRKAARTAKRFVRKGLMSFEDLHDSYFKTRVVKRHAKKAPAKRKKAVKHVTVTAAQILKGAKSHRLKTWLCVGPKRTGCGGGKRGGHVLASL